MKRCKFDFTNFHPARWVVATFAIVVIFAAVYVLAPEPALTPYEQMLQKVH